MIKRSSNRAEKVLDLLEKVRDSVKNGNYRDTRHSYERGIERNISLSEIIEVLEKNGYHEKNKDEYKDNFQSWNYAIRGKTFEGNELRIAVYFEEDLLMIATVIKLM